MQVAPLAVAAAPMFVAAEEVVAGNPFAVLTQLGIGGALVAFAVWLQDKYSKASDKALQEERMLTKQRTDQLIAELREKKDGT